MDLTTLLGRRLKDEKIVEVLEDYGVEWVLYDIDRNFENIPDVYWAPAKEAGFQLRFNEDQVLDTVFCYITASEGFSPISPQIVGVPIYATFDEAEATCRLNGDKYSTSNPVNGPRFHKLWLCVEGPVRRTHYQFASGILSLITLMLPEA